MNAKEAQVLIETIRGLIDGEKHQAERARDVVATGPTGVKLVKQQQTPVTAIGEAGAEAADAPRDFEKLYQRIKARLIKDSNDDPILMALIARGNELLVQVEPRRVTLDGSSLKGRIARQMASGFFNAAKTQGACRTELRRTGTDVNSGNLSTAINDFVRDGFLTREGDGYILAPAVKVSEQELKVT